MYYRLQIIKFHWSFVNWTFVWVFFPGGDSFLFAETALTPAVIGVIYHLYKSNFMISKRHSFYALIAMLIAFTVRPIEALPHLGPVLIYFFTLDTRTKFFLKN